MELSQEYTGDLDSQLSDNDSLLHFEELSSDDDLRQSERETLEESGIHKAERRNDMEERRDDLEERDGNEIKEGSLGPVFREGSLDPELIEFGQSSHLSDSEENSPEGEHNGEPEFVQSQSPEVIELDSEDEIENLEDGVHDGESVAGEGLEDDIEQIEQHLEVGQPDLNSQDSDEHPDNTDDFWLETPIVISVTGDKLLLVPHFKDPSVKEMISLFSIDEVASCTLHELLQLLRSGDLIDAYSFDVLEELRIDVPQMKLCFSEDNVHTRDVKLAELVQTFHQLRGLSITPMTLVLSTQKRFISQFRLASLYGDSGKTLGDLHAEKDLEPSKKRRYS